jgi:hypothetical protein
MNRGHMSAISTSLSPSGQRRICRWRPCEGTWAETRAPVFFDRRSPAEQVSMALKMLLVQGALSAMGFGLGVTAAPVLEWLRRAAPQAPERNAPLRRARPVTQGHLDELGRCIRRKQAPQAGPEGARTEGSEAGRQGVGISVAPEWRLLLAAFVGPRTCDRAWPLLPMTAAVVWGVPGFFSAGFRCARSALLEVYQSWKTFPRPGQPGRPKPPLQDPHPAVV